MTLSKLSPLATAVWEAFNQDEAGVLVDDGNKLAAALRALVGANAYEACGDGWYSLVIDASDIYDVADELDGKRDRAQLVSLADELEGADG